MILMTKQDLEELVKNGVKEGLKEVLSERSNKRKGGKGKSFLNGQESAKYLGVSYGTVLELIKNGRLQDIGITGKHKAIPVSQLDALIETGGYQKK